MHLRHLIVGSLVTPLYAQNPAPLSQEDVKAQEFADWQRTKGAEVERKTQEWHKALDQHRAAQQANSPSAAFLAGIVQHWPRTYRVRCTTTTSRSRNTYRTDTSCY
jgi:hypothetical protein